MRSYSSITLPLFFFTAACLPGFSFSFTGVRDEPEKTYIAWEVVAIAIKL